MKTIIDRERLLAISDGKGVTLGGDLIKMRSSRESSLWLEITM
jgi:hypothetical protein